MTIHVHYFKSTPPNFGDELNAHVWRSLIPELAHTEHEAVLVGIGTILDRTVPREGEVIVMGTGAGNAPLPPDLEHERYHILAVRGPLTAALAGLDPSLAVTDPALLLRAIYPQLLSLRSRRRPGKAIFVPHFQTAKDAGWRRACDRAGIEFVDPTADCLATLRRIASARLVIAEAMHAAIVADAFGVPWIPVASTRHFSTFKWVDWALSMRVPFKPVMFPAVSVRHGCQRAWLSLFAERCLVDDVVVSSDDSKATSSAPVQRLLRKTSKRLERPRLKSVTWMRLKAAALHDRVLDPAVEAFSRRFLRGMDNRLEERVAALLKDLASSEGYRSSDELKAARLETLQEKVAWIRERFAAEARPSRQARSNDRG